MSLVGTLGRVALGVALAKGVSSVVRNKAGGGASAGAGGGLGGVLGGLLGGQGGAASAGTGQTGGLGSLLGGGSAGSAAGGGALAGGLGGLLEQISGGGAAPAAAGGAAAAPNSGSLGDLLNRSLREEPVPEPDNAQEAMAKLFITAMINAAKSDGNIDQAEQQKIVGQLGDEVSDEEREFVLAEMKAPLDVEAFAKSVPAGAEQQVYMMSLMGIELDQPAEARYLDSLRKALNVSEQQANAIHTHLGAPVIYG